MKWLVFAMIAVGCVACGSEPTNRFQAEPPTEGPALVLAGEASDAELELEVSTQHVAELYGAAFRVHYDPGALRYAGLKPGVAFAPARGHVALGRVARPGVVVATVTQTGDAPAVAGGKLATLRFDRVGAAPTRVALERAALLTAEGRTLRLAGHAGTLEK